MYLGLGGGSVFFEYFFAVLLYRPEFFWGQTRRLKTLSEEKMKCIGRLEIFLEPFEKKFRPKFDEKVKIKLFFDLEISVKK